MKSLLPESADPVFASRSIRFNHAGIASFCAPTIHFLSSSGSFCPEIDVISQ